MKNKSPILRNGNTAGISAKKSPLRKVLRQWQLHLLMLAPIVYLLIFNYWPMYGAQIAFRNYRPRAGILGSEWVGLKWFVKFITSYDFGEILSNTLVLSLYSIIVGFPIPVFFALILNALPSERFKKCVWQNLGWNTIIYTAALASVSNDLHEAAMLDGASRWKRILHINLPCILPTVGIMLIMRCGSIMSIGFEKAYLMQNVLNKSVSQIIATYVYEVGMGSSSDMSFASAIGLFNSVINCILLVTVNAISNKVSHKEVSLF